jgi:hypothetical protein
MAQDFRRATTGLPDRAILDRLTATMLQSDALYRVPADKIAGVDT